MWLGSKSEVWYQRKAKWLFPIAALIYLLIANSASFAYENYFFSATLTTIEYDDPEIIMEDYERSDTWDEEGNVLTSTTCKRLKSRTERTAYRDTYILQSIEAVSYQYCLEETYDGEDEEGNHIALTEPQCTKQETRWQPVTIPVEPRNVVKVGEYQGRDIIHVVSNNQALKGDPGYLGNGYNKLINKGQGYHDAVMVTVYETEEIDPEDGQLKKVKKRIKTGKWKDKGSPVRKISESIPHKFQGVPVE